MVTIFLTKEDIKMKYLWSLLGDFRLVLQHYGSFNSKGLNSKELGVKRVFGIGSCWISTSDSEGCNEKNST